MQWKVAWYPVCKNFDSVLIFKSNLNEKIFHTRFNQNRILNDFDILRVVGGKAPFAKK